MNKKETFTYYGEMEYQKKLSLSLLEWHGGQGSSLYAVGSCMLSDSERGMKYEPKNHHGHPEAIKRAILELRNVKKNAIFPECLTPQMEKEAENLAVKLEKFI